MGIRFQKSVYEAADPEDGCRLIIMRRYPRGVARSRAHAWLPELAPSLPLVHWYHDNLKAIRREWEATDPARYRSELDRFWRTYSRRYLSEIKAQRRLIRVLGVLHRRFSMTFTLLCACPDHRICHRSLLGKLIRDAGASAGG